MSIFSAITAEHHNKILREKAKELADAINNEDWELADLVRKWLDSEPFGE